MKLWVVVLSWQVPCDRVYRDPTACRRRYRPVVRGATDQRAWQHHIVCPAASFEELHSAQVSGVMQPNKFRMNIHPELKNGRQP